MMQKMLCGVMIFFNIFLLARSIQRTEDPLVPKIIFKSANQEPCTLSYRHIQPEPFFDLFDYPYLIKHSLPKNMIEYRNKNGFVSGKVLSTLIENLLIEIREKKSKFKDFEVLKQRDFNKREKTGLIIVRTKHFPFVVKLFIETPKSMALPLSKGFEPTCFFFMGNGANRHLTGFTRIKNIENIREKIIHNSYWQNRISLPRKWFWLPENPCWIDLEGHNMTKDKNVIKISIPGIYAIVCDYIDIDRTFNLMNTDDRKKALDFSNFLHQSIDPHINNYVIEKKINSQHVSFDNHHHDDSNVALDTRNFFTSSDTEIFVPLDTEHFPTMVGTKNPGLCKNYFQWYVHLSIKMLIDCLGTTKKKYRFI